MEVFFQASSFLFKNTVAFVLCQFPLRIFLWFLSQFLVDVRLWVVSSVFVFFKKLLYFLDSKQHLITVSLLTVQQLKSTVPHVQNGRQVHISFSETFEARSVLELGLVWNYKVCFFYMNPHKVLGSTLFKDRFYSEKENTINSLTQMRSGFASKGIIRKLCFQSFLDVAIVDKGL